MSCFTDPEIEIKSRVVPQLAATLGCDFQLKFRLCARTTNGQPPAMKEFLVRYVLWLCRTRKRIPIDFIVELLQLAKQLFSKMPNVVPVSRLSPHADAATTSKFVGSVTVIGDIHGQFDDLCKMMFDATLVGFPSEANKIIFNGDLVDRGDTSVEVIVSALLLQVLHPSAVLVLRGNHESERVNALYGFSEEVWAKYDDVALLQQFADVFNTLPICAVLENEVFVVHGGLGPQTALMNIGEINALDRFVDPPEGSAVFELLWQDPVEEFIGFSRCRCRNTGAFGADITESFLARNQLRCIVRAHEEVIAGHRMNHNGKCITVFSAPNYMHDGENTGAVIRYADPLSMAPDIVQFTAEHYKTRKVLRQRLSVRNGRMYQYYA